MPSKSLSETKIQIPQKKKSPKKPKTCFILLYIIPLFLQKKKGLLLIRLLDIFLALFYIGNFNMYNFGILFYTNILLVILFVFFVLISFPKNRSEKFRKFFLFFRFIFFFFNLVIHFAGFINLIVNKKSIMENFFIKSRYKSEEEKFDQYFRLLIFFDFFFFLIDILHLSWYYFLIKMYLKKK